MAKLLVPLFLALVVMVAVTTVEAHHGHRREGGWHGHDHKHGGHDHTCGHHGGGGHHDHGKGGHHHHHHDGTRRHGGPYDGNRQGVDGNNYEPPQYTTPSTQPTSQQTVTVHSPSIYSSDSGSSSTRKDSDTVTSTSNYNSNSGSSSSNEGTDSFSSPHDYSGSSVSSHDSISPFSSDDSSSDFPTLKVSNQDQEEFETTIL
ncbi:uncharacterized protein LOC125958027 [Anopheles darlingi]|uniref:uncharacterized protein LOC125958027 n=1 Tax=Anopheles darlingi TaxID=43151 RepID=UPI00210003B7|nr:uncharacterized protein LOC125958027 [Anopheles darlingi]